MTIRIVPQHHFSPELGQRRARHATTILDKLVRRLVHKNMDKHCSQSSGSIGNMKRTALSVLFVVMAAWASATWTKSPSGYPYNWGSYLPFNSTSGPTHLNSSGSTITVTGSYSYTWYDRVTGSTNTAPPWTTPYASLYDNNFTKNQSYSYPLAAGYGCRVYDKLEVDEGAETWTEGGAYETRNGIKYYMVDPKHQEIWEMPPGQGGG